MNTLNWVNDRRDLFSLNEVNIGDLFLVINENLIYKLHNKASKSKLEGWTKTNILQYNPSGNPYVTCNTTATGQEVAVFSNSTNLNGSPNLTWDGTTLYVNGNIVAQGEVSAFSGSAPLNWWASMPLATISSIGGILLPGDTNTFLRADGQWMSVPPSVSYPSGTGIVRVTTGTAWDTTLTDNSTSWNTAVTWGNHASVGYWKNGSGNHPTTKSGYGITDMPGISGTPSNTYITRWTNGDTLSGDSNITWDGTTLTVVGNIVANGEISAFAGSAPSNWWSSMPTATVSANGGIQLYGVSDTTHFLRGDGSWQVVTGGSGMTYPSGSGFAIVASGTSWDTTIATNKIPVFSSAITGTPSSSTFLRGDGSWQTPASGTISASTPTTANGYLKAVSSAVTFVMSIVNADLANSTISGISLGNNLNNLTINNSGSGGTSGVTYNGSSILTISYNTIGAQPSNANLTSLASLSYGAAGAFVKMTATNTFALDLVSNYATSGHTHTLASATFANQGDVNYVLHGNASGNPSWGYVNKSQISAACAWTDATNTFGSYNQNFPSSYLRLSNPAGTYYYSFVGDAITAAYNITLPLLSSNDTMVTIGATQTLLNKTLSAGNTIAIYQSNFTLLDATVPTKIMAFNLASITAGNTRTITVPDRNLTLDNLTINTTASANGYVKVVSSAVTFAGSISSSDLSTRLNNFDSITYSSPGFLKMNGTNSYILDTNSYITTAGVNTFGAYNQNFQSSYLRLSNPAVTQYYTFIGAAISAGYNITLPLLTASDTMVTEAFTQTLSGKTLKGFIGADSTDSTKHVVFVLSNISTGNSRSIYFPDRDISLDNISTSTGSSGTGYLKGNGSTISFDNSTFLTTASGTAYDSASLNGQSASYYATASSLSGYLTTSGTAADSSKLNGQSASYYATASSLSSYLTTSATAADSSKLGGYPAYQYSNGDDGLMDNGVDWNAITYNNNETIHSQGFHLPNYTSPPATNYPFWDYGQLLTFASPHNAIYFPFQLAIGYTGNMAFRGQYHPSPPTAFTSAWVQVITSNNIASQTVSSASYATNAGTAGSCTTSTGRTDTSQYGIVWLGGGSASILYSCNGTTIQSSTAIIFASDFARTSDGRFKTHIREISEPINSRYVEYEWINQLGTKYYGVIAQELQLYHPELVKVGSEGKLTVLYNDLFAREIAYIKPKLSEHEIRIMELEIRVKELENRLHI
jgi:hypothetical protein